MPRRNRLTRAATAGGSLVDAPRLPDPQQCKMGGSGLLPCRLARRQRPAPAAHPFFPLSSMASRDALHDRDDAQVNADDFDLPLRPVSLADRAYQRIE